jgi:RNA polymerase sigma-70 factor, ECF subfamily
MPSSDKSLIARIKEGDDDAASQLYERYAARIFGLVNSRMGDRLKSLVEPQDIVQSIFKSVFRGLNTGAYEAPPGGTLWQLIALIAMNKVRKNATRRMASKRDARLTVPIDELTETNTQRRFSADEMEVAMREIVERLKPSEQEVVMLRVQSYSVEEIADGTNRSRRTVERLLQAARASLNADLFESDGGEIETIVADSD